METSVHPLIAHLDALVDNLRELVPLAMKDHDGKSVHHARVSTRRMKAAIDVLQVSITDEHRKPMARALSKLRRTLGPLRDADVMLGHLDTLPTGRFTEAVDWLRFRISAERQSAIERIEKGPGAAKMLARLGAWWGVREELVGHAGLADTHLVESLHLQLDAFAQLAGAMGDSNAAGVDPHQLRIVGKSLRYTLELAVAGGHKVPASIIRLFKRLQDALGLWHDYVVLAEQILRSSLDELVAHHDAHLQGALLDLSRFFVRRSAAKLSGFATLWEGQGQALCDTLRKAMPIIEPKMDHGPAGSF